MANISIIEINKRLFEKYKRDILEIEKDSFVSPWGIIQFLDELTNPSSHIWGLLEEDNIIGYICFWIVADEIHIMNIAIHPKNRSKGMAKILLNKLIHTALNNNVSNIWLEVRPSNVVAFNLYKNMGFQKVGIRKGYYSDTHEDAIIMSLNLIKYRR